VWNDSLYLNSIDGGSNHPPHINGDCSRS